MIDVSVIFDKLKPAFAVNAAIEAFGALLVFTVIIMAVFMRFEKGLFRYVLLAGLFTIIASLSDAVAAIFRGMEGTGARWAVLLGNFLGVAGLLWGAVFFANTLFYTYKDVSARTYKIFQRIVYCLGGVMTVVLIASQFTGWLYSIDESNLYRRGPLFFLSAVYTMAIILCTTAYMVIRRKQAGSKVPLHAALYIAIPAIGIVMQFVFYGFVVLQISLYVLMLIIITRVQTLNTRLMIEQTEALDKKEVELSQAHEKLILSQVQPHFIYNTLSAIKSIEGNPQKTKKTIDDFAAYLRGNLSALDETDVISVKKEIEHVKTYVSLERLRFGDRVNVDFDLKDLNFSVPPLSVQIFVENAVKHGITARYEGGTVKVSTAKEGGYHVVTVKDDGVGFDVSSLENSKRVGVRAATNRLQYFVAGEVEIISEKNEGTTVTIKIPDGFTPREKDDDMTQMGKKRWYL